jgi:nucleotide-binding universal stress UspA family protein
MTASSIGIRRILVAMDASPGSIEALKAAAHLAALLQAEIVGLYVEDEALLRGGGLPIARVVGSFSGSIRAIGPGELEGSLRTQASRARQAIESIAAQARVRFSFHVARGMVAEAVLTAGSDADLVSLGRRGWSLGDSHRLGGTTRAVLARARSHVLLLGNGLRPGNAVVVVFDGSEKSKVGLSLASSLAPGEATPLIVVLRARDPDTARDLEGAARTAFDRLQVRRTIRWRTISHADPGLLAAAARAEGIGVLILPSEETPERVSGKLLTGLDVPVLLVN